MRLVRCAVVLGVLVFTGMAVRLAVAQDAAPAKLASRMAAGQSEAAQPSASYLQLQQRLARGWNTWDVNSVTTQVLLPEGLAIHVGLKHNTTEGGDAYLGDALIGRQSQGAEQVTPGPHSWDGSYTDLEIAWEGHRWRVQSAREGSDLVLLATLLSSQATTVLPPTIVFSVNFLWDRAGTAARHADFIETRGASGVVPIYCSCVQPGGEASGGDGGRAAGRPVFCRRSGGAGGREHGPAPAARSD